ncbi:MAG TPA: transporter substrate-binding domain-containing protein [Thermoanaerobaculia bacterium]|jgi:ABC-type amino acid transport substrate-binding protein|nr:transporter substrate-binding domain-containing protein [Thermoanaerobaculia bacterium]
MRRFARTATFGLVALATAATAMPAAARSVAEIKKSGELVMISYLGANESFLRRVPGGGYEGLDYELVAGFARTLGVRLRVAPQARFAQLIPALLAGEGDLIASTMSITPEREQVVDFTGPYFPVVTMVLARKGSGFSGIGALAGKRVGVPPGTTLEARAAKMGFASITPTARTAAEALALLRSNQVDLVLMESSLALPVLTHEPDIAIIATLPEVEQYGIAVPTGSDLRQALDTFLASTRNGRSFYQLVLRYLGEHGVELLKVKGAPQSQPQPSR